MRRKRRAWGGLCAHRQPVDTRFVQRFCQGHRECSRVAFAGDLGTASIGNASRSASTMRVAWNSSRSEGVPPPRKIVSALGCPVAAPRVLSRGSRHPHRAGCPPRARRMMQSRNTRTCLRKRARARKARSADAKSPACYLRVGARLAEPPPRSSPSPGVPNASGNLCGHSVPHGKQNGDLLTAIGLDGGVNLRSWDERWPRCVSGIFWRARRTPASIPP